jgi:hypothetical protein
MCMTTEEQGFDESMAKDSKTTPAKKKSSLAKLARYAGRPPGPEEDKRSMRLAFRIHPDLTAELALIARENGEARSAWIERVVIAVINDHAGFKKLDAVGRYTDDYMISIGELVPDVDRPATVHPSTQIRGDSAAPRHERPRWNPAERPIPATRKKR